MNKVTEAILDVAAKKAAGYDIKTAESYSIVPCAQNQYLDPEHDPFKELEDTLMLMTLLKKHGIKMSDLSGI